MDNRFERYPEDDIGLSPSDEVLSEITRDFENLSEWKDEPQIIGNARETLLHHFSEHGLEEQFRKPYFDLVDRIEEEGRRSGKENVTVYFNFNSKDTHYDFGGDGKTAIIQVQPRNVTFRSQIERTNDVIISNLTGRKGQVEFRMLTLGGHTFETDYPSIRPLFGPAKFGSSHLNELPLSRSRRIIAMADDLTQPADHIYFNALSNRIANGRAKIYVGWAEIQNFLVGSIAKSKTVPFKVAAKSVKNMLEGAGLMEEVHEEAQILSKLFSKDNWFGRGLDG